MAKWYLFIFLSLITVLANQKKKCCYSKNNLFQTLFTWLSVEIQCSCYHFHKAREST